MMMLMSQIIILGLMIALGYYVFRRYPFRLTVLRVTVCALMIAVSTVLQLFSLTIPLMGFPSLKVGFGQLPIMVLGIFLNPAYAFFVGFIKDVVGLIVAPSGPFFLGFTLNTILVGVLPSLCYHSLKGQDLPALKRMTYASIAILWILSAMFILKPDWIGLDGFAITWGIRLSLLVLLLMLGILMARLVWRSRDPMFLIYAMGVFLVEVLVNFASTPLYLNIMYGIPIWMSIMVRMFKAAFMFPVTVTAGYFVLKTMIRLRREDKE